MKVASQRATGKVAVLGAVVVVVTVSMAALKRGALEVVTTRMDTADNG